MRWMNHKKSRVMDFFRRIDKDQDGKITRQEFIDGILASSESIHNSKHRSYLNSLQLLCRSCDLMAK
jgi:Ca2+-binding EF-hand superfamily protein